MEEKVLVKVIVIVPLTPSISHLSFPKLLSGINWPGTEGLGEGRHIPVIFTSGLFPGLDTVGLNTAITGFSSLMGRRVGVDSPFCGG